MGKKSTLFLGLGLVVVLTVAGFLYTRLAPSAENGQLADEPAQSQDSSASASQSQTSLAPSFPMEDPQGNTVQLSDFLGQKPVFLNFWASTCPPCKQEMPHFQTLYEEMGGDITFMMVNMTDGVDETVAKAKSHIESKGYTFPVYFDTELEAANAYSVTGLPLTYFVDSDGNLIAHARGAINAETLEKGISMISES